MSITLFTEAMSALLVARLYGAYCGIERRYRIGPHVNRRGRFHTRSHHHPDNEQHGVGDDNTRKSRAPVEVSTGGRANEGAEKLHAAVDADRNTFAVRRREPGSERRQ